ncbi:MAG: c-type cytochrome [Arcobacteraceae bacterium]|nr:c-type cytochrome [Arcobacteraceae bacterium]
MKNILKIATISLIGASYLFAGSAPKTYPAGELGKMVKLGEDISANTDTHPLTKDLVGNKLQCKSCHLKGDDGKTGTGDGISSWIGTATAFPAWSDREKSVQTLEDRSNACFMRSMNGKRLPNSSEASVAIASYITWLSTGMPINMNEKGPWSPHNTELYPKSAKSFKTIIEKATHANYVTGEQVYKAKCSSCHGENGEGVDGTFPPLWGQDANGKWLAYNTGAGMSKLAKAAAWVKSNMPLGEGGTLKDQEVADVVLYINAQPRADFDLQKGLLPKEQMGYFNSKVLEEKGSVRGNFKVLKLDIDEIRGDKKIK